MLRLRVIDLETTGIAPPAEVIEIGLTDVEVTPVGVTITPPRTRLFRPAGSIPPETMAVHHITAADIPGDAPPCSIELLQAAVWQDPTPNMFVAHNCEFERKFITEAVTGRAPWICTYKVALHVWPDAPRHSNQVLRYWRGLVLDPALAMPPHRAGPDAWVTAHLLGELLGRATTAEMVAWTHQPRPMAAIGFGKHKGMPWSAIPSDYLEWMSLQSDMDADAVWYARQELIARAVTRAPSQQTA